MSIVAEKTSVKTKMLESMYPSIDNDVLLEIARETETFRHAVVKCEAIVKPTFKSGATLETFKKQPKVAAREVTYLMQDMADMAILGPQVGDVSHQDEYANVGRVLVGDCSEWDEAYLFKHSTSGGSRTPPSSKKKKGGGGDDGTNTGGLMFQTSSTTFDHCLFPSTSQDDVFPLGVNDGGGRNAMLPSLPDDVEDPAALRWLDEPAADASGMHEDGTDGQGGGARRRGSSMLETEEYELDPDFAAAEQFATVFDPSTHKCSIAKELYLQRDGEMKDVDKVLPHLVPLLKSFIEGSTIIPAMQDVPMKIPLMGDVPVTTQETKIKTASMPPEAAKINIDCDTCFRVRLRQIKLDIEPIHFHFIRNGSQVPGVLYTVVKRAHLRLGMNVIVSANGNAEAEIYVAKLSLKKFSLRASMKYGAGVNACLTVARNMIKKVVEDEMSKALVGVHPL